MSKYIDELTELICDAVRTVFPNASLDDGYDVADDVIAKLPTIEVRDCSDYYKGYCSRYEDGCFYQCKEAPGVIPKPKESEWEELGQNKDKTHNIRCKACGAAFKSKGHANSFYTREKFRFCLGCGAKMRLE